MKRQRSISTKLDRYAVEDAIAAPSSPMPYKHRNLISSSLDNISTVPKSFFPNDKSTVSETTNRNSISSSLDDVARISTPPNFDRKEESKGTEDDIAQSQKPEEPPAIDSSLRYVPLSPSLSSLDDVEELLAKQQKSEKEKLKQSLLESKQKTEADRKILEITKKHQIDLAKKDQEISALKKQLDEMENKALKDIAAISIKEVEHLRTIATKDEQILNLQRQLHSKANDLTSEKKVAEEALASGKEYRQAFHRLEKDYKKLQTKYESLKQKNSHSSPEHEKENWPASASSHQDGDCAIFIDKSARSTDFSVDEYHSLSPNSPETEAKGNQSHSQQQRHIKTGNFRKEKMLNKSSPVSPSKAPILSSSSLDQQSASSLSISGHSRLKTSSVSENGGVNSIVPSTVCLDNTPENMYNKQLVIRRICEKHGVKSTLIFEGGIL